MGIPLSVGKLTPRTLWASLQQSYFCGRPTWTERDIPDLCGQVVIVTGGNSGLGKETVRALLQHNAKVYLACRSRAKAEAAISELYEITGREALFLAIDLADLSSINAGAKEFLSAQQILKMRRGIMVPPVDRVTSDGYDLTFGTNATSTSRNSSSPHFFLQPRQTQPPGASSTSPLAVPNYATFTDGPARRSMHPVDLYSQSKWANAVFSAELARRYGDEGIISTAINPGNLRTNLSRDAFGIAYLGTKMLMIWPVQWGVIGQLWAGTSPEGALLNGQYIAPWGRIVRARDDVNDPKCGEELWTWLEKQLQSNGL
ncbi:NAD(P)-binding protein [Mycena latifolia]|nr:NAD(P)-binding protein [Mycena latifolia]